MTSTVRTRWDLFTCCSPPKYVFTLSHAAWGNGKQYYPMICAVSHILAFKFWYFWSLTWRIEAAEENELPTLNSLLIEQVRYQIRQIEVRSCTLNIGTDLPPGPQIKTLSRLSKPLSENWTNEDDSHRHPHLCVSSRQGGESKSIFKPVSRVTYLHITVTRVAHGFG